MVSSRQLTVSSTRRDAWVEVDLGAIEFNVATILKWLAQPGSSERAKLMAVVKSDAYGHGAVGVAEVLVGAGAEWLAVASIDEGCQLRTVDTKTPVLLLSPVPIWAVQTALENDIDLTISSASQVHDIDAAASRKGLRARVHLKVDTGMHRLGVSADSVAAVLAEVASCTHLQLISVFSHLAKAEDLEATTYQNDQFKKVIETVRRLEPELITKQVVDKNEPLFFHLASSDATRRFPETHHDMVRVGLLLYGLEPAEVTGAVIPAMSVRARINQVSTIASGESVGYGWTWTAQRQTRLACVPIGYADGVDRKLSNQLTGLIMGKKVPEVGRISMDQMLFDVTDVPEAQEGDVITLVGTDGETTLNLAEWATTLDTITYELACRMRVRLPRIYTRHRHGAGSLT